MQVKHDLTESETYQRKQAQLEIEKDLLFSSFHQLKDWFDQVFQETVQLEEAAEDGLKKIYNGS